MKEDPLETLNFSNCHKAKKGEVSVSKKAERRTFLLWRGFVFHVRGFGCVHNEVLSTYGKSAHCKSRAFSSTAPTKN